MEAFFGDAIVDAQRVSDPLDEVEAGEIAMRLPLPHSHVTQPAYLAPG